MASGDYPQCAECRAWWSSDGVTWQEVPLPTAVNTLPSWTRLVTAHGLVFAVTGIATEPGTLWIGAPTRAQPAQRTEPLKKAGSAGGRPHPRPWHSRPELRHETLRWPITRVPTAIDRAQLLRERRLSAERE